ncbi:hypothetical protein HDV02_003463 [Globomyces sp. JEL0801]|nr:hypothetical protein HDV02_003463 [Globomyces sp. JEL0801]
MKSVIIHIEGSAIYLESILENYTVFPNSWPIVQWIDLYLTYFQISLSKSLPYLSVVRENAITEAAIVDITETAICDSTGVTEAAVNSITETAIVDITETAICD